MGYGPTGPHARTRPKHLEGTTEVQKGERARSVDDTARGVDRHCLIKVCRSPPPGVSIDTL